MPLFNNMNISVISRRSVLLVEETGVPWEKKLPTASEIKSRSWWDVLDITLCDKVSFWGTIMVLIVWWLGTGRWFSPGTTVSSTNRTDCHDITEILLKMALNTITLTCIRLLSEKEEKLKIQFWVDCVKSNIEGGRLSHLSRK
jgi:hypothetical protein